MALVPLQPLVELEISSQGSHSHILTMGGRGCPKEFFGLIFWPEEIVWVYDMKDAGVILGRKKH